MMTTDNISLALISLKKYLADYLDDNEWKKEYTIYLANDPILINKEIVFEAAKINQIALPLIILDTQITRNQVQEFGDENGRDLVTLAVIVMAQNSNQLLTLANIIRRKIERLTFNIKDYTKVSAPILDTGTIENAIMTNVSDPNAEHIADKYNAVINATLEINAKDFI